MSAGGEIKLCAMGGCDLSRWPHRLDWPEPLGPMCYFKIPGECRKEKFMCPLPRPDWWRAFAPLPNLARVVLPTPAVQLDFAAIARTLNSRSDYKRRAAEPREPGDE